MVMIECTSVGLSVAFPSLVWLTGDWWSAIRERAGFHLPPQLVKIRETPPYTVGTVDGAGWPEIFIPTVGKVSIFSLIESMYIYCMELIACHYTDLTRTLSNSWRLGKAELDQEGSSQVSSCNEGC